MAALQLLPAISSLYGRGFMDSELLLKFIEMFISQTTFRHRRIRFYAFFFWTTFVETAVYCRVFPETAVIS